MEYLLFRVFSSYRTNPKRGEPVLAEYCPDWAAHGESSAHFLSLPEWGRTWEEMQPTPSFICSILAVEKEKGMLFHCNEDLKYSHRLGAQSKFQAICSGTSAASKYWCPSFPKARKHKKLLCVLGGVQKSWNPGKEIQEVSVSVLWWEALNPQQFPMVSYTWASKSSVTTPQNIGQNCRQTYPAYCTSMPVTKMPCFATDHIEKPGFLMPTWMRLHAADISSFPAGGITQLSITHSLALHQPGWTGYVNPCIDGCWCWGKQPGAAGAPSKVVPEENRSKVHVLVHLQIPWDFSP